MIELSPSDPPLRYHTAGRVVIEGLESWPVVDRQKNHNRFGGMVAVVYDHDLANHICLLLNLFETTGEVCEEAKASLVSGHLSFVKTKDEGQVTKDNSDER